MKDLENFFTSKDDTAGKIIRSFRKNFSITQSELCEVTRVSEKYLSAVENDRRPIGLEVASKIGVFFGFDPSFLLFPEGLTGLNFQYKSIRKKANILISKKRKSA